MKVTRTEHPQADPMFYPNLLEENKQLKEDINRWKIAIIVKEESYDNLKQKLEKIEKLIDTDLSYIGHKFNKRLKKILEI